MRLRRLLLALGLVVPVVLAESAPAAAAEVGLLSVPGRIVDTRGPGGTVDGQLSGGGRRAAGSTLTIPIAGRAGVPGGAAGSIVNVTIDGATETGFVTVYPCDRPRPTTSNLNFIAGRTTAVLAVTRLSAGTVCAYVSGETHLIVDVTGWLDSGEFTALDAPSRLADSRSQGETVDGRFLGGGPHRDGTVSRIQVRGRGGLADTGAAVVLTVTADAARAPGFLTVYPCDATMPNASSLNFAIGDTVANTVITRVSAAGEICIFNRGATEVIVDVAGSLPSSVITPLTTPARLLDTRVGAATIDGKAVGKGRRPATSTLRLTVGGRAGVPANASAALVNITALGAGEGFVTAHPRASARPVASNLNYSPFRTVANAAVVRLGSRGEVCLHTSAGTDLIVDVVGWFTGPAPTTDTTNCPEQTLFPHYRMVALYGNDSASVLGVLGEQPAEVAALRLAQVAAPFEGLGGRAVLPAFEYIATVAQATPSGGLYRARSTDAQVQRYLDAARRSGVHLIIDIQPGRSDFLTEAKAYEKFLREPDVHIALDPEWRVGPNSVPGPVIGSVSAAEVNAVSEYVARLVAEEDLPEKLFVVHQFQVRMIPDRAKVVARPGLAIMFHMDGFGTRSEKMATWGFVQTGPPFYNGFKLFYDEDINMYRPNEVVAISPSPDLITYQ